MKKLLNAKRAPKAKKPAKSKYTKKQISEAIQKWTRVLESLNEDEMLPPPKLSPVVQTADYDVAKSDDLYAVAFTYSPDYTLVICPKANVPYEIENMAYTVLESSEVDRTNEEVLADAVQAAQRAGKLLANKGSIDDSDGVELVFSDYDVTTVTAQPLNDMLKQHFNAAPAYLDFHVPAKYSRN